MIETRSVGEQIDVERNIELWRAIVVDRGSFQAHRRRFVLEGQQTEAVAEHWAVIERPTQRRGATTRQPPQRATDDLARA